MDTTSFAAPVNGHPVSSEVRRLGRVVTASILSDVAFWMMVPLLSLRLARGGLEPVAIGFFASLPWLVLMLGAPIAPRLVARLGAVATLRLAIALQAVAVLGFASLDGYASLCVANGILGMGFGLGWVVSDSWVCGAGEASRRGRLIGLYETLAGGAMGVGPLLLTMVGTGDEKPFIAGGVLMVAAWATTLGVEEDRHLAIKSAPLRDMLQGCRSYPTIFLCAFLCGALEDASITLLPVHAVGRGYGGETAALLAGMMGIGNLAILYAIGTLCDRFGFRPVRLGAVLLMVLGLVAVLTLGSALPVLLPMIFVWGALVGSLRTTALVETGVTVRRVELVAVVSAMMAATTLGSVVGPAAAGVALSIEPQLGLFAALLAMVAVVGGPLLLVRHRARAHGAGQVEFAGITST